MSAMEEFSSSFEASLADPVSYLQPSEQLKTACLNGVKKLFDFYKSWSGEAQLSIPNGPLSELYIEDFDNEQIWAEIELLNDPVLKSLRKHIKRLSTHVAEQPKKAVSILKKRSSKPEPTEVKETDELDEVYSEDEMEVNEARVERNTYRKSVVDDKFFKLAEMEQFLEKAEKQTENDNVTDNVDNDSSSEEDDEEVDYFASLDSGQTEDDKQPLYDDFFDAPEPDPPEKKGSNKRVMAEEAGVDSDGESPDEGSEGESPDGDSEGESPDEDSDTDMDVSNEKQPLSTHEKKLLKMKLQIEKLEAVNLAPRAWQLAGETTAKGRPINSLLAEDLSFDHMSRPAPVITEETTKTLEDIIKQRVLDQAWDDVERKIKPAEKPFDYTRSQPLNQEKNKLSLAEVYEQEFLKKTQAEEDTKEDGRHVQIREMMKKLFVKLDALSNFHFTPKPPKAEVKVVANVPAINMEEVAPTSVSEADRLAPEELQAKSRRPEVGVTERTDTDRKHDRRLKKRRKRIQFAEKKRREKVIAKLKPGLGNKYAKKSLDKKLKEKEQDEMVDKTLKSSSRFFAKLQEQVKEQVKSVKQGQTEAGRRTTTSAHQYKL